MENDCTGAARPRAVERNTVTVPLPDVHAENRTLLTRVQYRQYPAGNALKYVQHDRCVPAANVTVLRESTAKPCGSSLAVRRPCAMSRASSERVMPFGFALYRFSRSSNTLGSKYAGCQFTAYNGIV